MKCEKLGSHMISYQSLLLSTTVLNDSYAKQKHMARDVKIRGQSVATLQLDMCNQKL